MSEKQGIGWAHNCGKNAWRYSFEDRCSYCGRKRPRFMPKAEVRLSEKTERDKVAMKD